MSFTTDDASQEDVERRRADRIARKKAKAKTSRSRRRITKAMHREEKKLFPNLTGNFDENSPLARHFTRKRD
jgi:hypothetical protein